MSERYGRIFSLQQRLYTSGAPVMISAGALLRDNETGRTVAQLKLLSVTSKVIKLVKLQLNCYDPMGRAIGDPVIHEYLDLQVRRDAEFGAKTAVRITDPATRSYTARVLEVGFADNSIWKDSGGEWEPIPKQAEMNAVLNDNLALRGYKSTYGNKASYAFAEHKDIWLCACGAINGRDEASCHACGVARDKLRSVDIEALKTEGRYLTAVNSLKNGDAAYAKAAFKDLNGYKDSADFVVKCDKAIKGIEIAKEKKSKTIKLIALICAAALFLGAVAYFVAYPLIARAAGEHSVFINMYNIKDYTIPDGTEEIKAAEFFGCDSLESVTIPDSVTSIGKEAFYNCDSLTSVTIPDSVTSIGSSAFSGCTGLTSVTIPDSVTSIGSSAFDGCTGLTSVTIGSGVRSIGNNAFYGCTGLTSVTIPDSVTSIGSSAFDGCSGLASVTVGSGVTDIGDYAFRGCGGLTGITIPDNVGSIGNEAFSRCSGLTSVTIGSGVRSIGNNAFYGCTGLTSVTIGSGVTSIGDDAFYNCTGLTSVTIPDSVTSIGNGAFYGCTGLTSVTFADTEGWWRAWSSGATSGTAISATDLANTSTAAGYLKSTYNYYYWFKN